MKKRRYRTCSFHSTLTALMSGRSCGPVPLILVVLLAAAAPAVVRAGGLDLPAEPEPWEEEGRAPEESVLGAEEPVETGEAEESEYVFGVAPVEQVRILVTEAETEEDRIIVLAEGYLPDGCTELYDTRVEREGDTFRVEMLTRRPRDRVCTEAVVPFRERIPLQVLDLPAGDYIVRVNEGAMGAFSVGVGREILGAETASE